MGIRKHIRSGAIVVAALLAVAGCASQKEPAEQALAGIEKTLSDSGAQIQKYLPDRYAEITAKVATLKDQLAKEEYGDVVADAPAVVAELRRAVADSAIQRAQTRVAMESEWAELLKTVPPMIEAVDKKLASQGSRLPKGMDRDAYRALVDSYDAARDSWGKASAEMTGANFEASVVAAREASATIAGVMQALGIAAT